MTGQNVPEAEWQDAMELYNDWLQTNNVGDYQILELKKYTSGRHQLEIV